MLLVPSGVGILRRRDEHDPLAFSLVGHSNDRVMLLGPQRLHQHFNRAQRNHLAGDLGEALGPPADRDEFFAIE